MLENQEGRESSSPRSGWTTVKPYLAMVFLQFGFAGMSIVAMAALKDGMSPSTFVVYRHAIATLAISPFAFACKRNSRPKMTLSIFLKIMALGFLEPVLDQNLFYTGMKHTSATFTAAMGNVLPAVGEGEYEGGLERGEGGGDDCIRGRGDGHDVVSWPGPSHAMD
ncbi:WAT1-related protein [Acorus calamus]|uniref:WAT1-related protein n=1 Tax=Acorus calamus TaxID=4465 RepID=A0AAV9DKH3_ACOCL|nr:WAT1-related protein [Acorus calamus]